MPKYQIYFDTQDGEIHRTVTIDENEVLDDLLGDILAEFEERDGYVLRGWREGLGNSVVRWEGIDLSGSLTLPEQGVRPNDVIRVSIKRPSLELRRDKVGQSSKQFTLALSQTRITFYLFISALTGFILLSALTDQEEIVALGTLNIAIIGMWVWALLKKARNCSGLPAALAALEFSRGFKPTGRSVNISPSRQRRLNPPRHPAPRTGFNRR